MKRWIFFYLLLFFLMLTGGGAFQTVLAEDAGVEAKELEEQEVTPPSVEGSYTFTLSGRQINDQAKANPDNQILKLNGLRQTVEAGITVSDHLDREEAWRWLFKLYGYRAYERQTPLNNDDDSFRFDELFADWSGDEWFVSLGKRRNSWGPAMAFNPVNVVVPARDPLNPDLQSEGHPMILANYGGEAISLDLIASRNYDRDWYGEYARWGGRLAFILDESDWGFYYFDGEADKDENPFTRLLGLSYSGNFLSDSTFYLEFASFAHHRRNIYDTSGEINIREETALKIAAGSNTTLDGNTSFLIELYHNSAGYTTEERENYFKTVDGIVSPFLDPSRVFVFGDHQFLEMNRNYLLLSYRKSEIRDQMAVSLQVLGAEDQSYVAEFKGDYNLSDYYKCALTLRFFGGDENSEFGNSMIRSEIKLGINITH